jgi:ferredoxin
LLKLVRRGFEHVIEIACDDDPEKLPCQGCQACVKVCPVSAIVPIGVKEMKKGA